MSAQTEDRIRQLCRTAVSAETEADAEVVIPELRSAIHEHIVLAKTSHQEQACTSSFDVDAPDAA
jgi:hypothetical protein